jgi:aryl-alcohol dehydrogenase-like predicted oxidoreductase
LNVSPEKILIGTASFGQSYGIANSSNPDAIECRGILQFAEKAGFHGVDTAADYLHAESIIGNHQSQALKVFTKLSRKVNLADPNDVFGSFQASLATLHRKEVRGVMPHSVENFLSSGADFVRSMETLKERGKISRWGLSLYAPEELTLALKIAKPDFVQVPLNYLDRRFQAGSFLDQVSTHGIELHVRSIFLQGALLMANEALPIQLEGIRIHLSELQDLARESGNSVYGFLLAFALNSPAVQLGIIGINDQRQIESLFHELQTINHFELESLPKVDLPFDRLLDPRLWSWRE